MQNRYYRVKSQTADYNPELEQQVQLALLKMLYAHGLLSESDYFDLERGLAKSDCPEPMTGQGR